MIKLCRTIKSELNKRHHIYRANRSLNSARTRESEPLKASTQLRLVGQVEGPLSVAFVPLIIAAPVTGIADFGEISPSSSLTDPTAYVEKHVLTLLLEDPRLNTA
ncbi:hypothetical protein N7495_009139 [Penicillium taxi]|uniref:uncharacterized protein n=1 Tax=Penicillium taxi TaxID=168475 RepID=UPI0025450CB0|nr:uncharacterized protein N7495_009139 [Penicillium taxi]KAJ5889098.1 hypothetical protein N7495_009139 [Penicillium taxi]